MPAQASAVKEQPEQCEESRSGGDRRQQHARADGERVWPIHTWSRWRGDAEQVIRRDDVAPREFEREALLSTSHRPPMIAGENGFDERRQKSEDRGVDTDLPDERDVHIWAVLLKNPFTGADEGPGCTNRETVWGAILDDLGLPLQNVRQASALGDQVDDAASAVPAVRPYARGPQIDGRPPTLQIRTIEEDVAHLLAGAADSPLVDELVFGDRHTATTSTGVRRITEYRARKRAPTSDA